MRSGGGEPPHITLIPTISNPQIPFLYGSPENIPLESCYMGNMSVKVIILLFSSVKQFLVIASVKVKKVIQGYAKRYSHNLFNPL